MALKIAYSFFLAGVVAGVGGVCWVQNLKKTKKSNNLCHFSTIPKIQKGLKNKGLFSQNSFAKTFPDLNLFGSKIWAKCREAVYNCYSSLLMWIVIHYRNIHGFNFEMVTQTLLGMSCHKPYTYLITFPKFKTELQNPSGPQHFK